MMLFRRGRGLALVLPALSLLVSSGCGPEPRPPEKEGLGGGAPSPATVSASELRILESERVGDRFRVSVALPFSYAETEERYPVVYALDANSWFGTYADVARVGAAVGELPKAIVVGVGYPAGRSGEVRALRARDFTPTRTEEQDARIQELAPQFDGRVVSGGAEAFLSFLRDELIPFVESHYRVDASRRVLFGHSFGGLFALDVLFQEPGLFTDYVIGSPSIWYGDELMLAKEADYAAAHEDLPARVFLTVGALEERDDPKSRRAAMVSNAVELARRLGARGYPHLLLQSLVFDGETHNGVVPPTFSRGLRFVFEGS